MNNIHIFIIFISAISIIVNIVTISKIKGSQENYSVDITGGFKNPCDCQGYCVVKK